MIGELADLDPVFAESCEGEAGILEVACKLRVHLVAVAVALHRRCCTVEAGDHGSFPEGDVTVPEVHRSISLLLSRDGDDVCPVSHLLTGGVGDSEDVPRVLDHRELKAEGDAEVRFFVLARILDRLDLAFNAPPAKSARNQDPVDVSEILRAERLCIQPPDVHLCRERSPGMLERLFDGHIDVLDPVLADYGDRHPVRVLP